MITVTGEIGLQVSVVRCCLCGSVSTTMTEVNMFADKGGLVGVMFVCLVCVNDKKLKTHTQLRISIDAVDVPELAAHAPLQITENSKDALLSRRCKQ